MEQIAVADYIQDEIGASLFHPLACHQIDSLIKKGKQVDELKAEWRRRWGLDYPYYKDVSGIKKM